MGTTHCWVCDRCGKHEPRLPNQVYRDDMELFPDGWLFRRPIRRLDTHTDIPALFCSLGCLLRDEVDRTPTQDLGQMVALLDSVRPWLGVEAPSSMTADLAVEQ